MNSLNLVSEELVWEQNMNLVRESSLCTHYRNYSSYETANSQPLQWAYLMPDHTARIQGPLSTFCVS